MVSLPGLSSTPAIMIGHKGTKKDPVSGSDPSLQEYQTVSFYSGEAALCKSGLPAFTS